MKPWTERRIAAHLQRHVFGNALMVVPNTAWTGAECDLLVVHKSGRLIDVEIKISRADFRADQLKDKWWHRMPHKARQHDERGWRAHIWPDKIWRHYYVIPHELWNPDLLSHISPASGVITLRRVGGGHIRHEVQRRVRCNPAAQPVTTSQALDIARYCSFRLWSALDRLDTLDGG